MLLVYAWRQQFTASRFNSSDHVRPWCVSRMWNMLKFIWSNERQRRGFKGCVSRATEVLISELEQERFKQSMMDLARHRDDQPQRQALQLAPSEGWLSVLLDELTPRQRSAVEMLVLAGRTGLEAMELEPGCKRPQDFYRRKRDGLNACRRILGKRTFTDRHGDHFRIDDQGKFIAA